MLIRTLQLSIFQIEPQSSDNWHATFQGRFQRQKLNVKSFNPNSTLGKSSHHFHSTKRKTHHLIVLGPTMNHPTTDWLHPSVNYLPPTPRSIQPRIGVIGCGGIIKHHLEAYRDAGWKVVALCDPILQRCQSARESFCPDAHLYTDYKDLISQSDIDVVDIATHPPERVKNIRASLLAGKHVLSQKPFVTDLDIGEELVRLAERCQRKLAVNQNGRWAPHFSYARHAIDAGLIGTTFAAHMSVHWDHSWVRGTAFENVKHLILYDFAIHWFDMLRMLLPHSDPTRVFASTNQAPHQNIMPHLLGQTLIEWTNAQATLAFDAALVHGQQDRLFIAGTEGSIFSVGETYQDQKLSLRNSLGEWSPRLQGKWFSDGFRGTMGELLCSIEENREPSINAADNLKSLALCFAAVASSQVHQPVTPGSIRRLPT